MTSKQSLAKFISDVQSWTYGVFEARGTTDALTKRKLNKWLSELKPLYYKGMLSLNQVSSFERLAKMGLTVKKFEEEYTRTVTALSTVDWTKATVLQRSLARRFKTGWKTFYAKYDETINNYSAKPLKEVQRLFLKSTTGKMLSFTDVKDREWQPDKYASMWARTRSAEVSDTVMVAEMEATGLKYVLVSNNNTTTPICTLYENKYFSLDGSGGLPKLEYRAPFHPNCRHIIGAVSSNKLEEYRRHNKKQDRIIQSKSSGFTEAEWRQIERQQNWLRENRPV